MGFSVLAECVFGKRSGFKDRHDFLQWFFQIMLVENEGIHRDSPPDAILSRLKPTPPAQLRLHRPAATPPKPHVLADNVALNVMSGFAAVREH
jgi:hypothetical protein